MNDSEPLSEIQLTQILDALEVRLSEKNTRHHQQLHPEPVFRNAERARKPVGRPRSEYNGQLHLKVFEDDQIWFKKTARSYEVQQGKLFNHLRKLFEKHG